MGGYECEVMIECEIKTGQTGESIENTRREGSNEVIIQVKMETVIELWREWK